ncbi:T7SS effector LXG polymorphic toxin [Terribacillus saccharophilus]|uniref:T7SS effector LXG polymorphic toxin n=1 Tax=Terribacillus saccharophilus TaxID=361277 RepID=UPI001596141B|nr:T7SS effector LXG polymorphic toxin [Terribacillus saccharophilus]
MKTIKNLDVQDIQQQVDSTKKFISQTKESIEHVKQAINGVTTLHDGFEGSTADSIRSFFEETHKPFLEFMNSFLIQYEETLLSVSEEVLSFESDEHGFIREEFLENELKRRLVKASTSLTSTTIDINQQLLYVKDIVNVPSVDSESFINSINKGKEKLSETLSNMYDMDAKATKKLDKPEQDIEQMKTYLAKLKDAIDKNNITVDSYSSEQLTKQKFYKDFKLQADGRQALTSDKPIPLTEQEYKALQDQIKDSKTVQDDRFEWDGEYFTLEDGRIIRAYTDTNSDSAVSRMAFEFVSSIPENREDLKEYKQEDGKNMFAGAVKGTVDFFFGDAITLFGPDATLEERAWAGVFLFVKPAKVLDKVGSPFLSSTKKYIDDLAESKGLPDAKPGKVDEVNDATKGTANLNLKYKEGYYVEHTTGPVKKFTERNGVSGGHNYNEFKSYFESNSNKYELDTVVKKEHPRVDGVFDIEYKVKYEKMDYTGKNGTGEYKVIPNKDKMYKKTVYDAKIISDDEMINLSKKAMAEGLSNKREIPLLKQKKIKIQGQTDYNGTKLKFEGIMNSETGEIENAYPVLEWVD